MKTEVPIPTLFYLSAQIDTLRPFFLAPEVFPPDLKIKKFSQWNYLCFQVWPSMEGCSKKYGPIRLFITDLSDGAKWGSLKRFLRLLLKILRIHLSS